MRQVDLIATIHLWRMEASLNAFEDENLSSRKRTRLELHLTECSHCREKLARIKRTSEILKGFRPESEKLASEDRLQTSFQDALNRTYRAPKLSSGNTPFRIIAVACTAFAVFFVGLELSSRRPEKAVRVVAQPPNVKLESSPLDQLCKQVKIIVFEAHKPAALESGSSKKTPFVAKIRYSRHRKRVFVSNSQRKRTKIVATNAEMMLRTDALATALWESGRESENSVLALKLTLNDEPHLVVRMINPVELDVLATVVDRPDPALPAYVEATALTSNALGRSSWRRCKLIKNGNFITNETLESESKWGEPISHLALSITTIAPVASGKQDVGKEMK